MTLVALPAPAPGDPGQARDAAYAFDDLFRSYAPRVKALAERRLAARHVADDVVQETFIRALRSLHTLDPNRPVWPWLKTVANNVCIDIIRQDRRTRTDDEFDEMREPVDGERNDPSEIHFASERRMGISAALAAVNPRQRRVLVLKDIEGWDTEEVAEFEGVSVDAVKSTLKRGRQTFRTRYLALAQQNGLLGTAIAVGGAVIAVARRLAERAKATEAYRIGGVVPIAQVVPLALVITIAGGALAIQREVARGSEAGPTTLSPSPKLAAEYDAVVSAGIGDNAHAAAAATPPTGKESAATSATLSPLPPTKDVSLGATMAHTSERVLVSVDVSATTPSLDGPSQSQWGYEFTCSGDARVAVCNASDAAWAAAQTPVPGA